MMDYQNILNTIRQAADELQTLINSSNGPNGHPQHQSSVVFAKVWGLVSELIPLVTSVNEETSARTKNAQATITSLQTTILEKEKDMEKIQKECGVLQQILL